MYAHACPRMPLGLPHRVAPRADPERVRAAVADVARFGPPYPLYLDPGTAALSRQQLCEPSQLRSLLGAIGDRVGSDEDRVTASTLQYGFAARCWSLVLGAWQRGGVVIDLRGLGYVVNPSGSVDLALNDFRGWEGSSMEFDEVVEVMAYSILSDQFTGFHAALRGVARVADGLLWGTRPRRCPRARAGLPRAGPTIGSRRWRLRCCPGLRCATRWFPRRSAAPVGVPVACGTAPGTGPSAATAR